MKTKIIYREPLGNPDRKYRQDRFIIGSCKSWGAGTQEEMKDFRRCIQLCKEIGCDMTDFIWVDPKITQECIMACEDFGIDGLFQNWDAFGGFQGARGEMKINMEEMLSFVEFAKKYRHFRGYVVWDEPLEDDALEAAAEQLRIIEEMDPDSIPYTVAIPSYNATYTWENGLYEDYLKRYAEKLNPCTMILDYYPFSSTRPEAFEQIDDSNLFLDIALLRKIGLEKKTPMWFVIQTLDSPFGEKYFDFAPAKVTMQAYNVLIHGGKGIQFYSTVESAMYNDGSKGPLYYHIKAMNKRIHQWGKTLMALTSVNVFHSPEVLRGNKNFEKFRESLSESHILSDENLPFRCSVGEFLDCENNRYLMMLNRDYNSSRRFKLNLKQAFRVYEVSGMDGMQIIRNRSTKSISVQLEPGDAIFLRFQDVKEEPYLIDYVLRK